MLVKLQLFSWSGFRGQLPLVVLPLLLVATAIWTRNQGGSNWLWFNLDPDYFYLLDALNILNLTTPGHVFHPGTTVQWLAALILKLAHPWTTSNAITDLVLVDPEKYLHLISVVFIFLNGLTLWWVGIIGRNVFGSLTAAGLLQLAPFISMVVINHIYHVKPEALLVFGTLVLATTAVLSLTPGLMARRRLHFAIAFGVVAGFGIATKVTAFPIFLLPLFVLGQGEGFFGWGRAVIIFGLTALVALVLFTLPALQAYDVFFAWMATVSQGPGAYGGGVPKDSMDLVIYIGHVFKLFKRPAFHIVFVLSLVVLVLAARRRINSGAFFGAEAWLLVGVMVSQLAHVLLIARQPNAMYMIPSFILIPLAFILVWRLGQEFISRNLDAGIALLFVVLIIAQGVAVIKLGQTQAKKNQAAGSINMTRFKSCARVYSYSASSPSYALMLADFVTKQRMSERLSAQGPDNDFWLEHWWDQSRIIFRDWRGPVDMGKVLANYPCLVIRASHWYILEQLLPNFKPVITFDELCLAGNETVAVKGVDCSGRLKKL